MSIKRFEELEIWKAAMAIVNNVYDINFRNDFGLKDQIQRAAVSTMSNIAEGYERGGNPEFIQFLYIAKGSCGEVRSQMYIAYDRKCVVEEEFKQTREKLARLSIMIANLIAHLRRSPINGIRYKRPQGPTAQEVYDEFMKEINAEKAGG